MDFDMNIYYNCQKTFSNDIKNFHNSNSIISGFDFGIFIPSEFFETKTVRKVNMKNGQDMSFFDKGISLDWEMFRNRKAEGENLIDIVIEFIPQVNGSSNSASDKIAFYTLCKFYEENG